MAKIRDKQPDADAGRVKVDEQLEGLEARLTSIYTQAGSELKTDLSNFLDKYEKEDSEKRSQVESGNMTEKEYSDWRERQIFRSDAMQAKIDDLSTRLVNVDQQAMSMVNNQLPETYATSYNFGGYRAETQANAAGFDYTQFTIINQDAVRTLATEDPDLIPWKPDVDVAEDEKWNRQHVQEAVQQGIVKGDSMDDVAKRLLPVVNMDRNAAIRTARTAVNGVENKGRKDATERVKEAGIPMVETWSCTHDDRTRDTHVLLDGTTADDNGMFGKGILAQLLAYPGDPSGDPAEVYNCRCSLVSSIKGIDHSKDDELYAQMMETEYFDDWVQIKEDIAEREESFQERKADLEEKQKESAEELTTKEKNVVEKIEEMEVYGGHDDLVNGIPMGSKEEIIIATKELKEARANGTESYVEKEVAVSDLITRQEWVDKSALIDMVNSGEFDGIISGEKSEYDNGIRVIETNGKYLIVDGNHRANLALLNEQDTIIVRVLEPANEQPEKETEPAIEEQKSVNYAGHKEDDDIQYQFANRITDEGAEAIAKDLGVSVDEAEDMGDAIINYSGYNFQYIRYASQGDIDSMHKLEEENGDWIDVDEMIKRSDDIEKFIELSPKWDGGELERGIHIKDEDTFNNMLEKAERGEAIDMKGMSSWTSNGDIAVNFAETWDKKSNSVILKTNETSTELGTSIRHLSSLKGEDEVLISKDAEFVPTRVESKDGITYIYGDLRRK